VQDACVVVCDGLRGLPDATTPTWEFTTVQARSFARPATAAAGAEPHLIPPNCSFSRASTAFRSGAAGAVEAGAELPMLVAAWDAPPPGGEAGHGSRPSRPWELPESRVRANTTAVARPYAINQRSTVTVAVAAPVASSHGNTSSKDRADDGEPLSGWLRQGELPALRARAPRRTGRALSVRVSGGCLVQTAPRPALTLRLTVLAESPPDLGGPRDRPARPDLGGEGEDEAGAVLSPDQPVQVNTDDAVEVTGTVVQVAQNSFEEHFGVPADELLTDVDAFFTDEEGDVAINASQVQVLQEQAAQP
jgi:hypothetical protein